MKFKDLLETAGLIFEFMWPWFLVDAIIFLVAELLHSGALFMFGVYGAIAILIFLLPQC